MKDANSMQVTASVGSAPRTASCKSQHMTRSSKTVMLRYSEASGHCAKSARCFRLPLHDKWSVSAGLLILLAVTLFTNVARADAPATQPAVQPLFDGKTLDKWKPTKFGGEGEVHVENGCLVIEAGVTLSGANYTGKTPNVNYEVELDARKLEGGDFFCGLTVPVGDSFATLIVGGWGGSLCGISCLD